MRSIVVHTSHQQQVYTCTDLLSMYKGNKNNIVFPSYIYRFFKFSQFPAACSRENQNIDRPAAGARTGAAEAAAAAAAARHSCPLR